MNRRVLAAALVVSLAACAQLKDRLLWSKGHTALVEGLRQYEEGVHLAAAKSLQGALEQGLTPRLMKLDEIFAASTMDQ